MSITTIILTFNEARHIQRCIRSAQAISDRVVIVDSNSTDDTCLIAAQMGADVFNNDWTNHATQFNWALDNTKVSTDWVFRLDADEVVSDELASALRATLQSSTSIAGFTVNRRIHFMGRWMRHGAVYPLRMLRIFRTGMGRCEQRWMDEHIIVDGPIGHAIGDIIDDNLQGLSWWTNKHNTYASREVADILLRSGHTDKEPTHRLGRQASFKRWLKNSVYARLPIGLRPLMYFGYRYFLRLGFLDGRQGLIFHVLQGFWYRFLVDAKLVEAKQRMQRRSETPEQTVAALFDIQT